jgi:hypothetical protein
MHNDEQMQATTGGFTYMHEFWRPMTNMSSRASNPVFWTMRYANVYANLGGRA